MPLLVWRVEFELGAPGLDHQDRELTALINQLHDSAARQRSSADTQALFNQLLAKTEAHFALAEKLMRTWRSTDDDVHKWRHEQLLNELRRIMEGCDQQGYPDAPLLGANWIGGSASIFAPMMPNCADRPHACESRAHHDIATFPVSVVC